MERFSLDFSLPFEIAIEELRSVHGKKIRHGSHNYHVLASLFVGDTIDSYENIPTDFSGNQIHNVTQRVHELTTKYGIDISSDFVDQKNYKCYWIQRGEDE